MPIKGLTESQRIPRIGKIHGGIKNDRDLPQQVDYFVVKEDASTPAWAAEAFHKVYGEKPKALDIVFPSDDIDQWADANYRYYSRGYGSVCTGDGEFARAKWDKNRSGPRPPEMPSGTWANSQTKDGDWEYRQIPCAGEDCPIYKAKNCKPVMNLMFMLPRVEGIGAWQMDTSSIHSIKNVRNNVALIKASTAVGDGYGRIRGLELKLTYEPKQVSPPGIKQKTVHVLNIALPQMKLADLVRAAAELPTYGIIAVPDLYRLQPPSAILREDEEPPSDGEEEISPEDSPFVDADYSMVPAQQAADETKREADKSPPAAAPVTTPTEMLNAIEQKHGLKAKQAAIRVMTRFYDTSSPGRLSEDQRVEYCELLRVRLLGEVHDHDIRYTAKGDPVCGKCGDDIIDTSQAALPVS